jgi:hypothetical protein
MVSKKIGLIALCSEDLSKHITHCVFKQNVEVLNVKRDGTKITPGLSVVNSTGINVAYRIRLAKRDEITDKIAL